MSEETGEKCVRCGEIGEDRRTLWHSCFYAMEELKVPFSEVLVRGELFEKVGEKELRFSEDPRFPAHTVPVFSDKATGPLRRDFYTLRVCKDCRSSWMAAIKQWFNAPIEKGITEEEWQRLAAERRQ